MWIAITISLVSLAVSGWACLIALAAFKNGSDLKQALAEMFVRAAAAEEAKTAAIEQVTAEIRAERGRLEALRHKYEKIYQESIVIDGPLGSKRVQ